MWTWAYKDWMKHYRYLYCEYTKNGAFPVTLRVATGPGKQAPSIIIGGQCDANFKDVFGLWDKVPHKPGVPFRIDVSNTPVEVLVDGEWHRQV